MIVLRKKYIITIFVCIILLVGIIGIINMNSNRETVSTVALPVENKVIILDSGHGYPDERCIKR